jgi:tRNA modification GTPase
VLTERVDIEGLAVTLVDTAGIRPALDAIEAEGVERARRAQHVAALTLVVVDRSQPIEAGDLASVRSGPGLRIVVVGKADLTAAWDRSALGGSDVEAVDVSALTGVGLDCLRRAIAAALLGREDLRDTPMISNARHLALVDRASAAVRRASDALGEGATEELVVIDLTEARAALEEITGSRTPDELLRHIFATFCIGK